MFTRPGFLLRLEGGCVLVLSIICYREIRANWILFAVLLLVPDLAMLGYLRGARIAAAVYNLVHTLSAPIALIAYAVLGINVAVTVRADLDFAHRPRPTTWLWPQISDPL